MKKYLAMICALIMLTAFASCGDISQDSSELLNSVSEPVTEEIVMKSIISLTDNLEFITLEKRTNAYNKVIKAIEKIEIEKQKEK